MPKPRQWIPKYQSAIGLRQNYAITNMPTGALLDVKNLNLDGLGNKTSRNGIQPIFHLTNGAGGARITDTVRSLIQFTPTTGSSQLLAFGGTRIFRQNGVDTDAVIIRSTLTANQPWEWVQYNDFIHGVNGSDTSFLYNGTNYVTISITPPGAHATLAEVGAGALTNGTYNYLYTFYDATRARESEPYNVNSPASIVVAANGPVRHSAPPAATAGEGVTHIRIYRKRLAETVFTRVAEVLLAAFPYDDNDNATGTNQLEFDNGSQDTGFTAHPQSKLIAEAFDRVFMVPESNPTLLVYSQAGGKSFAWPSGNFFPIGRKDGNRIQRIEPYGDGLLIHKRNGWWILEEDPVTGTPVRLSGVGTHNRRCSAVAENDVVRLAPDGYYLSSPTTFATGDLRESYIGGFIEDEEAAIDWNDTANVTMTYYRRNSSQHVYALFPKPLDYKTDVVVYDVALGEWVKYELATDIYSAAVYETSGEKRLMLGDGYGGIYQWDSGDADGSALEHDELNGTVTAAGASTLTDSTQSWTVNGLIGLVVNTRGGKGAHQRRRIIANTATQLTVDAAWSVSLDTTTTFSIAAIDKYGDEFWDSTGDQHRLKRMRWIVPYLEQSGDWDVEISARRDFAAGFDTTKTLSLAASGSAWGDLWGVMKWGASESTLRRLRISGKYHYYSIRYRNELAAQPFRWNGHGAVFQTLYDRNK